METQLVSATVMGFLGPLSSPEDVSWLDLSCLWGSWFKTSEMSTDCLIPGKFLVFALGIGPSHISSTLGQHRLVLHTEAHLFHSVGLGFPNDHWLC